TTAPVGDGSTPTKTGDIGVSALAALALISAAGVFVARKKRREI
ncbi:MAG: LPXTG cell wall anchor domain-containing protein, partial [Clostridiales bacterium]|nr:LPXTG cell wall anchor domain-containing protein [Clostridiales bacterium]